MPESAEKRPLVPRDRPLRRGYGAMAASDKLHDEASLGLLDHAFPVEAEASQRSPYRLSSQSSLRLTAQASSHHARCSPLS